MKFQPLSDTWNVYTTRLQEAERVPGTEMPDYLVWPPELYIGDDERKDIEKFVTDRMSEMVDYAQQRQGINLQWVSGYLFRSLIAGMLWERERVGR